MAKTVARYGVATLALAFALTPAPSKAIAPALLLVIKQIAQQAATSMIKDTLLSGLSGMGCKGMALSNALAAFDLRSAAGGAGMLAGMPKLPAGMAMPNLPTGAAGLPLGGLPIGGLPQGGGLPAETAARMSELMPGAGMLAPGMAMSPEQMAMTASLLQAISQPLSPPETLATIDELFELGFLPKAIQAELEECMVLVPQASAALGMGMGMLKPIIPQLRQAREELHALSPAEQDEVAAVLGQELKALPADQRAGLIEHLDSGFFPPRVSAGAKAALGVR